MIKNYLKVALRNMFRFRGFSLITILGFAAGLACVLMIMLYNLDELSYDGHYAKADRIYRSGVSAALNATSFSGPVSTAPLAEASKREIPEVQAVTRFRNYGFPVLRYRDKAFSEERFFWADPSFFDVFSVRFIKGDAKSALAQTNAVVLTRSMARKYFADEDPIGKTLNADRRRDYVVTAVVEDPPRQTHFHFDFLGSLAIYEDSKSTLWISNNYYTYFLLRPGASPQRFEENLNAMAIKHLRPLFERMFGVSWEQLQRSGAYYRLFIQPLRDIHLRSHMSYEIEPNGDIAYVYLFSLVVFGVFVLACINFINLTTARASTRAKEIAIRKTIGSNRRRLVGQFMLEAVLTTAIALIIAFFLVALCQPLFNRIAGGDMKISLTQNPGLLPLLLLMLLFGSLLAGSYPAFYLTSFQPSAVFKGERGGGRHKPRLRGVLVVFQFALSIILIIGTLVVYRQLRFLQDQKLGFNKEQVLLIRKADDLGQQMRAFKQELLARPGILSVANTSHVMGTPRYNDNVFQATGSSGVAQHIIQMLNCDEDFTRVFQIGMAAGRTFQKGNAADEKGVVLNESAARALGLSDPVGKEIQSLGDNRRWTILGVMRDFNFESLRHPVRPFLLFNLGEKGIGVLLAVRVNPGNIRDTLAFIQKTWLRFTGGQAFEYEFYDDYFARLYRAEAWTAKLLLVFSFLAILIASLGLLGLSAFAIQQRTKEIGIRKVLGASVFGISRLLSREFLKLVLLANLVAWPLAYYAMNHWLRGYAYRTRIGFWIFLGSGLLALVIAVLTVSYQSIRAARQNPVESLRYE